MRSRTVVMMVAGVLVIALAAGCGSKKSSSGATTAATTAAAAQDSGSGSGSGSGSKSFASTKNCKELEGLASKLAQSFQPNSNGELDLSKEADALDTLADAAPDDIKGDFNTFADAFQNFAKAYGDVKLKPGATPTAAQIAKLTELSKSFNTAKLQQASRHLAAWGQSHCGISATG
jgi:ABC-type Zn uptake system ZnuABC Zn-binding protein ZnuA